MDLDPIRWSLAIPMLPQPPALVQSLPYSNYDKEIVAATLIGEAGGETEKGMQAVLNVILNRAREDPKRVREVCLLPFSFSFWNGKEVAAGISQAREHPCWVQALMIVEQGLQGKLEDITAGANHFYAHELVNPPWAKNMRRTAVIGRHTFLFGH